MSNKPIFEKKNVLVTGGAGFVGSRLCEQLIKDGSRVICIDDFSSGVERNIDVLLKNPDFQFLRVDINKVLDLEEFPELEAYKIPFQGIQEIYHLACPTAIKRFDALKIHTLKTNSIGTINILDMAERYESRVVFTSSSVVYGSRAEDRLFFVESDEGIVDHMTPRAVYDEGKRFSETSCITYLQTRGVDARIARIFRTYGPRMPLFDGHLIPDFIINALDGKPLVIYGDENFKTSLIYVDDVVDGLMKLMEVEQNPGPVNIGSDVDMRLVDVANMIIEITGSSSTVDFEPPLPFLTELGLPKIALARDALAWLPLIRLEDGLRETMKDVRANRILLTNIYNNKK
ncbi:NAD-dependent epimerase/dehydratase family protein [Candidatus Uhrbacteria bacterium]|nr:NAD-dependent epimerase/dehydratase family protein [Candidatus Uhrbacteria bacterium]